MNNSDNKGTKIQHHRYSNTSKRGKRKLHKGRVAGAVLSLVLVVGLCIGGYKLIGKIGGSLGQSDSILTNVNVPGDSSSQSDNVTTSIVTVKPSIDTIVTTTTTTTTSDITSTTDTEGTIRTTLATIIDDYGNIVIPDSTKGYDKYYVPVDDGQNITYSNDSNDDSNDNDSPNDDGNTNGDGNGGTNTDDSNQDGNGSPTNSNSYYLSEDDISSIETLKSVIGKVDTSSYNIVVLPLKAQGGTLNYNSKINSAINSGVVNSYVDLEDMVQTIKDAGFIPYASISVLYDNIYPQTYKSSAYQFEDGTGSWWDNDSENGGKPWLSPFSEDTKNYLSALVAELTEDGIQGIVCEDVMFPNFRDKDLDYIGDLVKDENRYTALVDVLNTIQKSANGQEVLFKFSLVDALKGDVEALKPDELNSNIVLSPYIQLSELSSTFSYGGNSISLSSQSTYNKVKLSMELFEKMSGDLKVVPSIDVSSLTASQKKDVISALQDMGYSDYLLLQ